MIAVNDNNGASTIALSSAGTRFLLFYQQARSKFAIMRMVSTPYNDVRLERYLALMPDSRADARFPRWPHDVQNHASHADWEAWPHLPAIGLGEDNAPQIFG